MIQLIILLGIISIIDFSTKKIPANVPVSQDKFVFHFLQQTCASAQSA